jgi:DNA-binding beta-propeller fold protein YncE
MPSPERALHVSSTVLPGTELATGVAIDDAGSLVAVARSTRDGSPAVLVFDRTGSPVDMWGHDAFLARCVCFAGRADGDPALYAVLYAPGGHALIRRGPVGQPDSDQLATYGGNLGPHGLASSSDGRLLAVYGRSLAVWDLAAQSLIASTPPRDDGPLLAATFLPGSHAMAVLGLVDDVVIEVDGPTLTERRRWPAPGFAGAHGAGQVVVSPDCGQLLVASSGQVGVYLYDLLNSERALPVFFHDLTTVGTYAFPEPSLLLRVVGSRLSAIDLSGPTFIAGPRLSTGNRETGIASAPDGAHVVIGWSESDAIVATFAVTTSTD